MQTGGRIKPADGLHRGEYSRQRKFEQDGQDEQDYSGAGVNVEPVDRYQGRSEKFLSC
jgi:hypothetical protein